MGNCCQGEELCHGYGRAAFPCARVVSYLKSIENLLCLFEFSLQVFEFLIRLHSTEGSVDEEVYPYVRTLLHFDTREFLNVLALVRDCSSPRGKRDVGSSIICVTVV